MRGAARALSSATRCHARRAPRWASLALAAALALGPAPARAQATAEEKASAESLFTHALGLMERDETTAACPLFEEVVRLTAGLGAQIELAKCYEAAGRLASAWATYREVSQRDRGRRAKEARAAAERLEPNLAHLSVEVPATTAARPGLEVRRDGRPVLREVWGVSIPVDPGEHRLEASAGAARWAAQISLAQGGARAVVVGPLVESPPPAAPAAPPAAPHHPGGDGAPPASTGRAQRILGLSAGGLGLIGLGVGVALGLDAKATYRAQRDRSACDENNVCSAEGDRASRHARSRGDLGTIVGSVGAGAVVGGVLLYLTAPSPPAAAARSPALSWRPALGRGAASLDLALRW